MANNWGDVHGAEAIAKRACCEHCHDTAEEVKRHYEREYYRGRSEAYDAVIEFMDHGEASPNAGVLLNEVIERLKDFEVGVSDAGFDHGVEAMRRPAAERALHLCKSFGLDDSMAELIAREIRSIVVVRG